MRFRCGWDAFGGIWEIAFSVRFGCVWDPLGFIWDAFSLKCAWSAFEARLDCGRSAFWAAFAVALFQKRARFRRKVRFYWMHFAGAGAGTDPKTDPKTHLRRTSNASQMDPNRHEKYPKRTCKHTCIRYGLLNASPHAFKARV